MPNRLCAPLLDASEPLSRSEGVAQTARESLDARPKGIFMLGEESYDLIYPQTIREEIDRHADIIGQPVFTQAFIERKGELADVEVIFSGWGMPRLDAAALQSMPNLKAVFYGAGSVRYFTTDVFWKSGVQVSSANAANAVPVAEYTLGAILLSLKQFWTFSRKAKSGEGWGDHTRPITGAYRSKVGLVSFGQIARRTLSLLRQFDLDVCVHCPFLTEDEAIRHGVTLCSLETIFHDCDVVSLHTPDLPETRRMIRREHFAQMRPNATFINTARGAVVCEKGLAEVAASRSDLSFILDVTAPEPPAESSPLYTLPNVVLTPHIAGSMGPEVQRMGEYMLDELKRYVQGKPLRWAITREAAEKMA